MNKVIISAALAAAISAGGYMGFRANNSSSNQLSDVMLANIEAIARNEGGGMFGFNCGRAAYEWSGMSPDDPYARTFTRCASGCPDASGANALYIDCMY